MSHVFRKRPTPGDLDRLYKEGLITKEMRDYGKRKQSANRKDFSRVLKAKEKLRQFNYDEVRKFAKEHRRGPNMWDKSESREIFKTKCKAIGRIDAELDHLRLRMGLAPKKYPWNPYQFEDEEGTGEDD